jgi:hypothetical protein
MSAVLREPVYGRRLIGPRPPSPTAFLHVRSEEKTNGQIRAIGVKQVDEHIWLVTFMHYDLGCRARRQKGCRRYVEAFTAARFELESAIRVAAF